MNNKLTNPYVGPRPFTRAEASDTGGLPNEAVKQLSDQFLLRAESRAGGTWYELSHDRFVEPILKSNEAWKQAEQEKAWVAAGWYEQSAGLRRYVNYGRWFVAP